MENTTWLLMANAAVWLGVGGYLFLLGRNQKQLEQRIRQMELISNDD